MPQSYAKLLVVEDNATLADFVRDYLDTAGYSVAVIADGHQACQTIIDQQPDLTILDIMLPGLDGMEVCRRVRPHYSAPILMLTARDEAMDEILGLEIGADDYLTKPVDPKLLLSRIRANLRRAREFNQPLRGEPAGGMPELLEVDRRNREVRCQGEPIDLTGPEFDLLDLLEANAGEVLSRDDIMRGLRGIEYDGHSRMIDMLISSLRAKLPFNQAIKTVRNRGYLLVERHRLSACDK